MKLDSQFAEYRAAVGRQQIDDAFHLRDAFIHTAVGTVALKALDQAIAQYAILQRSTADKPLPPCDSFLWKTQGIPCSHRLQDIRERGQTLTATDFNEHWHLDRRVERVERPIQNLLYLIDAPARVRGIGRPARINKTPASSTQRAASAFEIVENNQPTMSARGRRDRGRGRPRGRPRGSARGRGAGRGNAEVADQGLHGISSQEVDGGSFIIFQM